MGDIVDPTTNTKLYANVKLNTIPNINGEYKHDENGDGAFSGFPSDMFKLPVERLRSNGRSIGSKATASTIIKSSTVWLQPKTVKASSEPLPTSSTRQLRDQRLDDLTTISLSRPVTIQDRIS